MLTFTPPMRFERALFTFFLGSFKFFINYEKRFNFWSTIQLISLIQTSNITLLNKTETILLLEQAGRRD